MLDLDTEVDCKGSLFASYLKKHFNEGNTDCEEAVSLRNTSDFKVLPLSTPFNS